MFGSYREEIEKLEALYGEHPEGRVFTHLAEAYRKAGELTRARQLLETGLQRHPMYSSAHVVMGRVFMDEGELPAAQQCFLRVVELDPHNVVALRALAELAQNEGREVDAVGYYDSVLALDPMDEAAASYVETHGAVESPTEAVPEAEPGFEPVRDAEAGGRATRDDAWDVAFSGLSGLDAAEAEAAETEGQAEAQGMDLEGLAAARIDGEPVSLDDESETQPVGEAGEEAWLESTVPADDLTADAVHEVWAESVGEESARVAGPEPETESYPAELEEHEPLHPGDVASGAPSAGAEIPAADIISAGEPEAAEPETPVAEEVVLDGLAFQVPPPVVAEPTLTEEAAGWQPGSGEPSVPGEPSVADDGLAVLEGANPEDVAAAGEPPTLEGPPPLEEPEAVDEAVYDEFQDLGLPYGEGPGADLSSEDVAPWAGDVKEGAAPAEEWRAPWEEAASAAGEGPQGEEGAKATGYEMWLEEVVEEAAAGGEPEASSGAGQAGEEESSGETPDALQAGGATAAAPQQDEEVETAGQGYAAAEAAGERGEEMLTETMADLYMRQGFYDRAAELLRQLMHQRGHDVRLEVKLVEAEYQLKIGLAGGMTEPGADLEAASQELSPGEGVLSPLAGASEAEPAQEASSAEIPDSPEALEAAEPWLPAAEEEEMEPGPSQPGIEDVEAVWTGRQGVAAGRASPYAWGPEPTVEPEQTEEAGGSIRDYLGDLMGWAKPAGARTQEPPSSEAAPAAGDDDDLEMFRAWLQSLKR